MRLSASLLSGVAVAVLAALPLAFFCGGVGGCHGAVAMCSLLLGFCAALFAWKITKDGSESENKPVKLWEGLMIGVFCFASARVFFWLFYQVGDSWKILSPNNLGDLSLHLSFIHWLAATQHWWPASPILAGDPLRYPLGSDLFNSLLLVVGIPVEQGLLWCALGGAALTGIALWRWGRGMALAALLFNGGLAGVVMLHGGDPDALSEWKNLFLTLFVTQRGFLFALPAGLLLLCAWRKEHFESPRTVALPLSLQALLLASLPLFSIHAALYLGVAMVGVLFFSEGDRSRLLRLACLAWPPMAFLGWLVATGAGGPSAVKAIGWNMGWMSDGTLFFWLWNFGISLPLGAWIVVLLLRSGSSRAARAFVWPAAVVFLLCLFVRFAPWPWDNVKLMLWSWIVVAPFLWSLLISKWPALPRVIVLVLLFASGAVTLCSGLDGRHGYEILKRSKLDETAWNLRNVPAESVIACYPEYNNPVLVLGHPVVCGYEGHLWSHGLDYKGRMKMLDEVMKGQPGWREKARKLKIYAIYWGDLEKEHYPDSKLPWAGESVPALHRLDETK